jgi:hypothetical protein
MLVIVPKAICVALTTAFEGRQTLDVQTDCDNQTGLSGVVVV